jgi:hypothetical protein
MSRIVRKTENRAAAMAAAERAADALPEWWQERFRAFPRARALFVRRYTRSRSPHFIYVIEGPTACYVGCTTEPDRRWRTHRSAAAKSKGFSRALIHHAMRRDGVDLYTFSVVQQLPSERGAEDAEYAWVEKLRALGKRVVNVYPRLPQHVAPRFGRVDGVVVNGKLEPL